MATKKDYYQILGVEKNVSSQDLKKAYHALAMQHHPDRNPNNKGAAEKFKEISEAYDVLKDEKKRAAYDQFGHGFEQTAGSRGGGYHADINVNDIFGDFFSDFMGGSGGRSRRPSSKIPGSDLKYNVIITLEEAFKGVERDISFSAETKCSTCNGTGSEDNSQPINCDACNGHGVVRMQQGFFTVEQPCRKCFGSGQIVKNPCKKCTGNGRISQARNLRVNIPAGIENNTTIKLTGEGEAGIRGGNPGSMHVVVAVKPHDIFKTEGANLHCKLPISFVKATLGGEIELPTIGSEKVLLKIPAGTQNGDKLRLKEKGMSKIRSSMRGDLYTHIHIMTPQNLTKKQKDALELFGKEMGEEIVGDSNFFDKMKNLWS